MREECEERHVMEETFPVDNLIRTLSNAFGVSDRHAPSLEGIAIALAGAGLNYPVGESLSEIAGALQRIAGVLERQELNGINK